MSPYAPDLLSLSSEHRIPHSVATMLNGVSFANLPVIQNAENQDLVLILQGTDLEMFRKIIHYIVSNGMVDFPEKEEKNHLANKRPLGGTGAEFMGVYPRKIKAYITQQSDFAQPENKPDLIPKNKFLEQVNDEIEARLDDENFRAVHIAKRLNLCEMQLHRKLKKYAQLSPANYIRKYRLFRSRSLLKDENLSVTEVCFMVGFRSLEYFSRSFKKEFGVCPSNYIRAEF